jgi:hypothetical protein
MRSLRVMVTAVLVIGVVSAAFAGSVIKGKEKAILESLGLRSQGVINGGTTTLKTGSSFKTVVVDANKLASHGITGAKKGDAVMITVTGDNTFTVSSVPTAMRKAGGDPGSAAVQGNAPATQSPQGSTATSLKGASQGGGTLAPGAAQSLNFTKTFTISGNGKVTPQ